MIFQIKNQIQSQSNFPRKEYNKNNLKYVLEKNLSHINSLFHKFALAIHNLVYGEIIEQNIFELYS